MATSIKGLSARPKRPLTHKAKAASTEKPPKHSKSEKLKNHLSKQQLKHGLGCIKHLILPDESEREYRKLRKDFVKMYDPCTMLELLLVEKVVESHWKCRRLNKMTGSLLSSSIQDLPEWKKKMEQFERAEYLSNTHKMEEFALYSRYEVTQNKELYKAMHELERVQAKRRGEKTPMPKALDVNISI